MNVGAMEGGIYRSVDGGSTWTKLGGGRSNIAKQHEKGKLTARERIELLIDPGTPFLEIGLHTAHEMYAEEGGAVGEALGDGLGGVRDGRLGEAVPGLDAFTGSLLEEGTTKRSGEQIAATIGAVGGTLSSSGGGV